MSRFLSGGLYACTYIHVVEPKCVSEGTDTCTSQISKRFCPVELKQLSKPVEKMGIKQLTSLVPTEDDADLEYCTSLLPVDRFIQNRGSQGRGRRRISRYDNQIGKEV